MAHFDIQIVSDTVCPWCYVGKNRLDAAISTYKTTHPTSTFTTTWAPFYLNPSAPHPSVSKQAHYESKFGAPRTQMMQAHLSRLGAQVGINFAFGGKTGNTRDSHRLIRYAQQQGGEGMQTRVVEELFASYFEKEEDITDHGVLLSCATKAGLEEKGVRALLESEEGGEEVDKEVGDAKRKFVTGVPNFTINGRYEVQGAEEPAAFLEIFERIGGEEDGKAGRTNGVNGAVERGEVC